MDKISCWYNYDFGRQVFRVTMSNKIWDKNKIKILRFINEKLVGDINRFSEK